MKWIKFDEKQLPQLDFSMLWRCIWDDEICYFVGQINHVDVEMGRLRVSVDNNCGCCYMFSSVQFEDITHYLIIEGPDES